MKRKILSLVLALALCLGMAVPVFAADTVTEALDGTVTKTLDGVTITIAPDRILGFSGTGELTVSHLNAVMAIFVEYAYADPTDTVSVNIAPGITYDDNITGYGGIQAAFEKVALDDWGFELTVNVNATPSAPAQPSGLTVNPNSSTVLVNGKDVSFDAYTIEGNNYFKLRDIGQALDFGIGWDNATKTITIDTSTGYTA